MPLLWVTVGFNVGESKHVRNDVLLTRYEEFKIISETEGSMISLEKSHRVAIYAVIAEHQKTIVVIE